MPSNFSGGLETTGAPVAPIEKPVSDYSRNIEVAGQAVANLAGAFKKDNTDEWMGSFSAQLASLEEGAANYAQTLQDLSMQTRGASAEKLQKVYSEMDRVRRGEIQGVLTPTKARLEIDNLVKVFSQANPSLAKDIRMMANTAKGSLSEVVNEAIGLDPFVKQTLEGWSKAQENGMSPEAYQKKLQADALVDNATKQAQVESLTGGVTKNKVTQSATRFAYGRVDQAYNQFITGFENLVKAGTPPTTDQIVAEISNLRQTLSMDVQGHVIQNYGVEGTGSWSFGGEDFKTVMMPIESALNNLEKYLTGSAHTPDQKLKNLKMANDIFAEQSTADLWKDLGPLGAILAAAKSVSPATADAVFTGYISSAAIKKQYESVGAAPKDAMRNEAEAQLRAGNNTGALAIYSAVNALESGFESKVLIDFLTGKNYKTGNPHLDARVVADGITVFTQIPDPKARAELAPNLLTNVSWSRLMKTPDLAETVARDPSLTPMALSKATSHVLSTLAESGDSADAVTFDPLRGVNPFNYKDEISISSTRTGAIVELNNTYRGILRYYGADVAAEWVQSLIQPDTQHGLSKDGNFGVSAPKKKVTPTEFVEPISQAEKAHGVPEGLLYALAGAESSYDPTAKGPVLKDGTRALGLMQIIPKWHPGVDPMNPSEAIPYAAKFLREQFDRFGTWEKALAAYNWGPENMGRVANDPDWMQKIPRETRNYIKKIIYG